MAWALKRDATCRECLEVRQEGSRQIESRPVQFFRRDERNHETAF